MHYVDCKVETLADVEARNNPADRILIANMKSNDYDRIVTTATGWKWTQPLRADDVVLESNA